MVVLSASGEETRCQDSISHRYMPCVSVTRLTQVHAPGPGSVSDALSHRLRQPGE